MTKVKKIGLGAIAFLFPAFKITTAALTASGPIADTDTEVTIVVLVVLIIGILLILGAFFFIRLVYRNKGMHWKEKIGWSIALLWAGFVAAPAYWYLHIWREGQEWGNAVRATPVEE